MRRRIVKYGVAVAERSALGILAGQPNRRAGRQQRRERERFRRAPIDDAFLGDRARAPLELRAQLAVERKACRHAISASLQATSVRAVDRRQRRAVEGVAAGHLAARDMRRQRAFDGVARFLQPLRRFVDHRARTAPA